MKINEVGAKFEKKLERPFEQIHTFIILKDHYPPASEASREVLNLTERKNPQPPHKRCQRICLSVCLWSNLNPIISGLVEQNGLKNSKTAIFGIFAWK